MTVDSTTISIPRGNDRNLRATVSQDDVVVDITGWTIFFTVKRDTDQEDADAAITKTVTPDDPTNGICNIALTDDDTDIAEGIYRYDVKVKDDQDKLQNSSVGNFIIEDRVTIRES